MKKFLLTIAGLALCGFVLIVAAMALSDARPQHETLAAQSVTMDDFDQLRDGMDIDNVRRVLVTAGTHDSHSSYGNSTADTWTWRYPDGSSVVVMFLNGGLTSKAQRGLH